MDSSHSNHYSQTLSQGPFYYYHPEFDQEYLQRTVFSAHHDVNQVDTPVQSGQFYSGATTQYQPSTILPRSSLMATPVRLQTKPVFNTCTPMTPIASPRPLHQKPAFMYQNEGPQLLLDTEQYSDLYMCPLTPTLSVSGSSTGSSPSTCGLVHTPITATFYSLENIEGVKEGCEGDVQSEILAGGDWTRCGTPPLTQSESNRSFTRSRDCNAPAFILLM